MTYGISSSFFSIFLFFITLSSSAFIDVSFIPNLACRAPRPRTSNWKLFNIIQLITMNLNSYRPCCHYFLVFLLFFFRPIDILVESIKTSLFMYVQMGKIIIILRDRRRLEWVPGIMFEVPIQFISFFIENIQSSSWFLFHQCVFVP